MTLNQLHLLNARVQALRSDHASLLRMTHFNPGAKTTRALQETERLLAILQHVEISQPLPQPIVDLL